MTAQHDDPDRIRAELEERFLREMKEMFDEVEYPPESRRRMAREIVEAAEGQAVNRTAAAWALAYDREVGPLKYGVRVQLIEEGWLNATRADEDWAEAQTLLNEANRRYDGGDHEGAEPLLLNALSLMERTGDEQAVATCLMNVAWIEIDRGDLDDARPRLEQAAEILNRLGYQEQTGKAMAHLGKLAARRGDRDAAREWWGRALTRYTNAGKRDGKDAQDLIRLLGSS